MTAKILHLSEYLEKFKWNITRSVASVMGLNPDNGVDVKKADFMITNAAEKKFNGDIHELQTNLVAVLEAKDDEAVKDLLNTREFNEETFNGVDIAEGFNFHCQVGNQVARSNIMDWLEEGGLDYLIDNDGRFAVKCPTRKVEYKVGRAFEHMTNKWDRGPIRKAVDPDPIRKGLADIKRFGLSDGVNEEQTNEIAAHQPTYSPGTGKGVETGLGPSMFPADKKKKTKYFKDDELDNMVKESNEILNEGKKKKKKTAKQREKEAAEKLAAMGPEGSGGAEQMMKDFGKHGTDPERIDKEQKHKEKKKNRQKVDITKVDESAKLDENVMGMIGMPTIGRMKELAGLPDDTKIEVVMKSEEVPSCEEYSGLDLANDKLKDTFNVYKALPCDEKEEFRKSLIDCLMKED